MAVKVSVVVPVYNPGRYIEELIESLTRQSLPPDEFEAIFVDDGSTDGTGKRLDAVAAKHPNFTAIHIPNSGWPGRPRNVGMDAATGAYVYFVDNDDWLGDEALERVHDFAERTGADVVVPREVGHGKGVSRELFMRNVEDATLAHDPLLVLLTPHKVFRKEFLVEHDIRFPEGRRRLEDHVFVMRAYFLARRISILSDYPCYHWVQREDAGNATDRYAEPRAYYDNVREILDIVDQHVEPGPERDRFYAHWYRSKGLHRFRGALWVGTPNAHALSIFTEVRRLAIERFGAGVARALPAKYRVLSRSVHADRPDLIGAQARIERGMRADLTLETLEWSDWRLRLSLTARLVHADGTPVVLTRRDGRVSWRAPAPLGADPAILPEDLDVTDELGASTLSVVVRNRHTRLEYAVPAWRGEPIGPGTEGDHPIEVSANADVDLRTVATGGTLDGGVWDFHVHLESCGWSVIKRLPVVGRRAPEPRLVAEPYATEYGNLSVTIKAPAPQPATSTQRTPRPLSGPRRALAAAWRPVYNAALRVAPPRVKAIAKAVLIKTKAWRR